jgi:Cysteine-rich secretory protein family
MRPAALLLLLGLTGCALDRPAESAPPPGAVSPGQWTPQPSQPWSAASPAPQQPWPAPTPLAPAPPPAAVQAFPWPTGWLPAPVAWPSALPALPAGWPSVPGLPGLSPVQPAPVQPAPGQPAPGQPAPQLGASGDVAQRCVDDINGYRATKGLAPLARWVDGESCAAGEAAADARSQQAHGSFGACREGAQNACPNWPAPADRMIDQCLKSMWDEGPGEFPAHGHYENMASPRSTSVACAIHTMADGRLWAVQDFR